MGARLLSFLSCRAYGKFGITAVMRLADAVRPISAEVSASSPPATAISCEWAGDGEDRPSAARTGVDHDQ